LCVRDGTDRGERDPDAAPPLDLLQPHRLVYTWRAGDDQVSRVTVRFEPRGDATEVIVIHEQIPNEAVRESHEGGWKGCLDGLERLFAAA